MKNLLNSNHPYLGEVQNGNYFSSVNSFRMETPGGGDPPPPPPTPGPKPFPPEPPQPPTPKPKQANTPK